MKNKTSFPQLAGIQIAVENINDKMREMVKLLKEIKKISKENAILEDRLFVENLFSLSEEDYD